MDDVERIQETVPGIIRVSPMLWTSRCRCRTICTPIRGTLRGSRRSCRSIQKMELAEGRLLSPRTMCSNGRTLR